ncbi:MAG: hypothetical protein ACI8X5_003328 [Planctomycetota bacterium]|jgi:hypothetical protein
MRVAIANEGSTLKKLLVVLAVVIAFVFGLVMGRGLDDTSSEPLAARTEVEPEPIAGESTHELRAPVPEAEPSGVEFTRAAVPISEEPHPEIPTTPVRRDSQEVPASGSITVTVVDAVGAPIAGATVSTRSAPPAVAGSDIFSLRARTAAGRTNFAGMYEIEDIPFGEIRVLAEAENLAPAISAPVVLSEEQPHASVQVQVSVGGRVVGQLSDIHGQPAKWIDLSIHPGREDRASAPLRIQQVATERDGSFQFERLPPGKWKLYTRAKDQDLARVPAQQVEVEVREGETTVARFKDLSALAVQVSGLVLRNGEPVPRASISASWSDRSRLHFRRTTVSDPDGRFQLTLDEGGDYRFQVSSPPTSGSTFLEVTIPQAPTHELNLTFETAGLSGTVYGPDGDVVVGAAVMAINKPAGAGQSSIGKATTDHDGQYEIGGLTPGSYMVSAQMSGEASTPFQGAAWSDKVTLVQGDVLSGVDVHLSASGLIEGLVTDEDGRPAVGAKVEIRTPRGPNGARSGDDGRFAVGGMLEGSCWVRATRGESTSPWVATAALNNEVTWVDLVMAPGAKVIAEVDDQAGPMEAAIVSLNSGDEVTVLTIIVKNGKGSISAVPPGTYNVLARRDWRDKEGPKAEATITVAGTEEHVLRLILH